MILGEDEASFAPLLFDETERGGLVPNLNCFAATLAAKFVPVTYNNTLYICNAELLYQENKGEVQSCIQAFCERVGYTKPIESLKRELLGRMRDMHVVADYPFNQYPGFPVANGVVVFGEEIGLVPYEPQMLFTRKIPVRYNPDADVLPAEQVIERWVDMGNTCSVTMFGEEVEVVKDKVLLYQIPAQAILQSLPGREPSKKAYLIMGESNGGKSTYLVVLSRLFHGHRNFSGVSLQTMGSKDTFWKQSIVGKLMNVCDDLQAVPVDSTECLKQVTGLREHEVNPKGKDRHMADLTAVHVFTCNRPPEIRGIAETDDAFWGRWEYIVFPGVFEKVDGWVERTVTPEFLEGMLLTVLRYAQYMYLHDCLMIRSEGADIKELWKTDATPLRQFLDESTVDGGDSEYVYIEEVFVQMQRWKDDGSVTDQERLHRQRRSPMTLKALSQAMLRYGYNTRMVQRSGKRRKAYVGLRWKPGAVYSPVETKDGRLM